MPNVLNEFAGDGVTKTFNFSMTGGYLSRDYVFFFTRPNDDLLNYTPYDDDDVTWITDFSVQTANPIPVGTTFVILRSTTLEPLVDFQNTSRITEKNLDTATWQSIHIAAETSDTVGRIQIVSSEASDLSKRAIQEATDAADDAEAARVAAQAAQVSAGLSSDAAGVAETKAEQAALDAQTAVNTAAAADGKVDAATLAANAADQKADSAIITAIAATTKASTAIETANGAVTTANAADSKANTAVATSNSATSTADAATTTAGEAKTIAQEAKDLIDSVVSGAVVSFNGRAGIVTPEVGDYTKAMVGLGNVDNVSSADLRDRTTHTGTQPISTVVGLQDALGSKVDKVAGKQLSTEDFTSAEKAKLLGVATGATANSTDAFLRDRANHTGTQPATTISGLGNAALADYQVSLSDTSVGRLMAVGAFGLGGVEINWPSTTFNYTPAPTGFYRATNSVAAAPEPGEFWGVLIERAPDGEYIKQTVWGLSNKRSFVRIITGGVAGAWRQIMTSLECNFSIIGPDVTKIAPNTRYVLDNPFGTSQVICVAEISVAGVWGETGWAYSNGGYGVKASQIGTSIVIQTGSVALAASSEDSGNPLVTVTPVSSAPCRVKVWKVNS